MWLEFILWNSQDSFTNTKGFSKEIEKNTLMNRLLAYYVFQNNDQDNFGIWLKPHYSFVTNHDLPEN